MMWIIFPYKPVQGRVYVEQHIMYLWSFACYNAVTQTQSQTANHLRHKDYIRGPWTEWMMYCTTRLSSVVWLFLTLQEECVSAYPKIVFHLSVESSGSLLHLCLAPFFERQIYHGILDTMLAPSSVLRTWHRDRLVLHSLYLLCNLYHLIHVW